MPGTVPSCSSASPRSSPKTRRARQESIVMIGSQLLAYGWVAFGSALGGMARYWLGGVVARGIGDDFPYGTLLINVMGSFVIGFFGTLTLPDGPRPVSLDLRLF